jgi:hypothetical protein
VIPGEPTPEVEVVGLEVLRRHRGQRIAFADSQLDPERLDDRPRDLLLHGEDVGQLAVIGLRPELVPILHTHELGRDPQAIAAPPHAALEHGADIQTPPHLPHVGVSALELEGGGPGGDPKAFDLAQGGDQLFGQPVAEVLLVLVGAHIDEWKHRGGGSGRAGARPAPFEGEIAAHQRQGHHGGERDPPPGAPSRRRRGRGRDRLRLCRTVQRGREVGRGREAVAWRPGQRTIDRPVERRRDVANRTQVGRRPGETLGEDRLLARAGERRLAGQHLVEHAAQGVDVRARIDGALADRLLGAHVVRRAQREAGLGQPVVTRFVRRERPGDAEVGDQRMAAGQEDVLRLDVSVDHPMLVGVVQPVGHLTRDADGIGHRQLALARQPAPQRFAIHERHGEPELSLVRAVTTDSS